MLRFLVFLSCLTTASNVLAVDTSSEGIADHAVENYTDAAIQLLADLLPHVTVNDGQQPNAENPEFLAMTETLRKAAAELGLDFEDHGAVVIVGIGDAKDRLGLVTHGDIQPANPKKWKNDPFSLDRESEPGRLVGRGVEDDKGSIACAMYAMKSLADSKLPLRRRVELIVSYTEESDWTPFQEFLKTYEMPELNVALDAEYPVVTAEKGWCRLSVGLDLAPEAGVENEITEFSGGAFLSQVPEDATVVVQRPTEAFRSRLEEEADKYMNVYFSFETRSDRSLAIHARGVAAHSSKPTEGWNAIAYLADLMGRSGRIVGPAVPMVQFVNDLVGTGYYGERLGRVAYSHPFTGRLTCVLSTLVRDGDRLVANLNLRRPVGKANDVMETELRQAVTRWEKRRKVSADSLSMYIGDPYWIETAEHVDVLLDVFGHYTGMEDPQPIGIGGGTHARLVPNGVNFGPSMPGEPYTGHSEHEFVSDEQFRLNLRMYAAMMAELAVER